MAWIKAKKRFNGHDAGTVFEADKADAEKWVDNGFAEKAEKPDDGGQTTDDGKEKGKEGPDKDKAVKEKEVVKK